MSTGDNYKRIFVSARDALLGHGVDSVHLEFILFHMWYTGEDYAKALDFYAVWRGVDARWLHNQLCGTLLRQGKEIGPEALLSKLVKEVNCDRLDRVWPQSKLIGEVNCED